MSTDVRVEPAPRRTAPAEPVGTLATLRRGLSLSPELRAGLPGTLALALASTLGKVAVPIAVQQGLDHGVRAAGGPDLGYVAVVGALTVLLLVLAVGSAYLMNYRLYRTTETALSGLRIRTFGHVHALSVLHQQDERRGALVSRVTADIDQISRFLQFSGVSLVVNAGQVVVATVVMLVYSWPLTIAVLAVFVPLALLMPRLQRWQQAAYRAVRERVGVLYAAVAESVVGAPVIRAYGVSGRTAGRLSDAIERYRAAQYGAQRRSVVMSTLSEGASGLTNTLVVIGGVVLGAGLAHELGAGFSVGELTAFVFLAGLFVQPIQMFTETLTEAQNAVAGWRRVLDILDAEPEVVDPGERARPVPPGPLAVRFADVGYAYPGGGPEALADADVTIAPGTAIAVVGETGSGKTTFAKLLTRLMDPTRGQVLLSGVPLDRVGFAELRRRVVMVPQDGFLFDTTVGRNAAFVRPDLPDADLTAAFTELGLADWLAGLPAGLDTPVGERGEYLSVGERQLVALVRAYVADPDLLILDEATSAVDPATEVRLQRALDAVTRGRTTVTVAHRLSTAEAADEVLVFDAGRIVQRGRHEQLVAAPDSVYGRLHASWLEQTR
ncbi:multidrug ABC transporter ATP-binding protein [Actinocatenispora thailandica]|uniref:Multidrug ABC transporter ATP-binding protein n=1 Tax=Actinocatenispora thailandica TaxID=227318 RepID=A0A7R7DP03_9ACTN|nr:ABC transporter ATP-binding protein [Actinocatenispora thailandica]BCJ34985.1 multidrug ABC transporter ATP-binding protein [Actinocatenispora thailandica]